MSPPPLDDRPSPRSPVSDVHLDVDGIGMLVKPESNETLAVTLRSCGVPTVKVGCEAGHCGACSVLLDGRPVPACCVLTRLADRAKVETAASLIRSRTGSAFADVATAQQTFQCGFCAPGILATTVTILGRDGRRTSRAPTNEQRQRELTEALVGNLCRCTGYRGIVDAVLATAEVLDSELPTRPTLVEP